MRYFIPVVLVLASCVSTTMETPAPGGAAVVLTPPSESNKDHTISVRFNQADIKTVLDLIARSSDMSIIMNPDVSGSVTYSADRTPPRRILDEVAHQCGLKVVPEKSGILRVAAP